MIHTRMSAALAVRDGYTGKAITQSTVRCWLDGQPHIPQYRRGGYLVFVNLPDGEHELLLKGGYFQDERLTFTCGEKPFERNVTLKPAPNYPFYSAVTQLAATLKEKGKPVAGRVLWVAAKAASEEIKLAQDLAGAGDTSLKLYFRGAAEGRFPRNYLIADGKKSEIVPISGAQDALASLDMPLKYEHKRGVALYPAQAYLTGENGQILAFFREAVPVEVFDPDKNTLSSLVLAQGRNEAELPKAPREKE